MKYVYDLHIHSALSPCGDVLLTPNNIFNMASLKHLDIISITDHNSLKQLPVCYELSKSYDFLFIPGVEITVKEGFDVLCYFKYIEEAIEFDQILEAYLPKQTYDHSFYGEQWICNIDDEVVSIYPYLLATPLDLGIERLIDILRPYEHILIYAHIDKKTKSGIDYIHKYPLDGIEYRDKTRINNRTDLSNSDAHQITELLEVNEYNQIELDTLSIDAFFRYFGHD